MNKLLIAYIDDNLIERKRIEKALLTSRLAQNISLLSFERPEDFLQLLKVREFDILLLDIDLARGNHTGIDFIRDAKQIRPQLAVFMYSGLDHTSVIASAMGAGADDFILKKENTQRLFERVLESYEAIQRKNWTRTTPQEIHNKGKIRIAGDTMRRILHEIPFLLESAISCVYVEGDTGTGKEVVAQVIESCLPSKTPFLSVNCAALTETLLESELFGHIKGAFTGAQQDKIGLVEAASGGWLFLDEVSSLSLRAQSLLLRCIESQKIRKIGEQKETQIQVRFLSASNEPLEVLVNRGKFRRDLWQRLKERKIELPNLAQRTNEIPDLIQHFCETLPGGPYNATAATFEVLSQFSWRDGNIRELRNVLKTMTLYSINQTLTPLCIPISFWNKLKSELDHQSEIFTMEEGTKIDTIQIPVQASSKFCFQHYSDYLLIELIRRLHIQFKKSNISPSLRLIAQHLDLSREVLSHRIKVLKAEGKIRDEEISKWIGTPGRKATQKTHA